MVDKWLIIYAIDDLNSIPTDFTIFNVSFFKFSDKDKTQWKILNAKQDEDETLSSKFLQKNCASVQVDSEDGNKALDIALEKIEDALSALRVFKGFRELRRPLMALAKNLNNQIEKLSFNALWHREMCAIYF